MENKRGIFISTVSQVMVRLITLVIALVSIKLLTNYLGTEGTGYYNTITTYVNFAIIIADLGLFSAAVREISKAPEKERHILSNVFTIRVYTALVAAVVAGSLVYLTDYSPQIKLGAAIAAGYIFFNLVASTFDIVLQYRLKMQFSAFAEFLSKVVTVIALYIVVRLNGGFLWTISTVTLSGLVILTLKWLFSRRILPFGPKYDRDLSSWILRTSLPLGIVFIVNNLYFKIDTLLLFAIKGAAAVGIYSVAYKVLEVTIFIGSYFGSSLKPLLSKYIDSEPDQVAKIVDRALQLMLFAGLPISVLSAVFAHGIILFLSNASFISGAGALVMLSFTLPIIYCDVLFGEVLIAKDARKLLIRISIFIVLFNVALNLFFIPRYSFYGAAFTTLFSEFVLMVINIYYVHRLIPLKLDLLALARIGFAAVLTLSFGMLVRNLPVHFLLSMALTGVFYLATCYALNVFRPQEIRAILKSP